MFAYNTELANTPSPPFDPTRLDDADHGGGCRPMDLSPKSRRTNPKFENYRKSKFHGGGGEVQFRPENPDDDSGVCSPPLWKQHQRRQQSPPPSRAQAIARGQRELMEMVKNMPESCYELSLKDIVDHAGPEKEEECLIAEKSLSNLGPNPKPNQKRKVKMVRNGSMEKQGLLLNMVFPVGLGSKKKTKKVLATKVSPATATEKSVKGTEKEWWRKRFSPAPAPVESESSGASSRSGSRGSSSSSSNSRSSSSRSNSGRMGSGRLHDCWSFLHQSQNKSKPAK